MQSSHKLLQYSRGRQKIKIKGQDWFLHFEVLCSVNSDAIKFTWKREFMGALPQEKLFSEHVSCWTRVSKTSRCNCQQNRFTEALSSTTAFGIPVTDEKMTCPDFFWGSLKVMSLTVCFRSCLVLCRSPLWARATLLGVPIGLSSHTMKRFLMFQDLLCLQHTLRYSPWLFLVFRGNFCSKKGFIPAGIRF